MGNLRGSVRTLGPRLRAYRRRPTSFPNIFECFDLCPYLESICLGRLAACRRLQTLCIPVSSITAETVPS